MYWHVSGDTSPPGAHSWNTGHTPHGTAVNAELSGMGKLAGRYTTMTFSM